MMSQDSTSERESRRTISVTVLAYAAGIILLLGVGYLWMNLPRQRAVRAARKFNEFVQANRTRAQICGDVNPSDCFGEVYLDPSGGVIVTVHLRKSNIDQALLWLQTYVPVLAKPASTFQFSRPIGAIFFASDDQGALPIASSNYFLGDKQMFILSGQSLSTSMTALLRRW